MFQRKKRWAVPVLTYLPLAVLWMGKSFLRNCGAIFPGQLVHITGQQAHSIRILSRPSGERIDFFMSNHTILGNFFHKTHCRQLPERTSFGRGHAAQLEGHSAVLLQCCTCCMCGEHRIGTCDFASASFAALGSSVHELNNTSASAASAASTP